MKRSAMCLCLSFVRLMQSLSTTEKKNSQRFDPITNDYDFIVTVILAETVHGLFCWLVQILRKKPGLDQAEVMVMLRAVCGETRDGQVFAGEDGGQEERDWHARPDRDLITHELWKKAKKWWQHTDDVKKEVERDVWELTAVIIVFEVSHETCWEHIWVFHAKK